MTRSDPITTVRPLTVSFARTEDTECPVSDQELIQALQDSTVVTAAPDPDTADLRVQIQANSVYRFYRQGQTTALAAFRIPFKKPRAIPLKLLRLLEHVAAFSNLRDLQAPNEALANAVKVDYLQLLEPATRRRAAEVAPLTLNEAGEYLLKSGQRLAIALNNQALTLMHVYLIAMDTRQQSVNLIYPYQPDFPARLRPSETLLIGSGPDYLLEMPLPEGETQSVDLFKLWISSNPVQPGVMIMPPLGQRQEVPTDPYGTGSRLDRDLRRAIIGKSGTTPLPSFTDSLWWSQQQGIRVVKD